MCPKTRHLRTHRHACELLILKTKRNFENSKLGLPFQYGSRLEKNLHNYTKRLVLSISVVGFTVFLDKLAPPSRKVTPTTWDFGSGAVQLNETMGGSNVGLSVSSVATPARGKRQMMP